MQFDTAEIFARYHAIYTLNVWLANITIRMIRNLVWLNGVSTDEKFVKEFMGKLEAEGAKNNAKHPVVSWDKRHVREQSLLGVNIS